MILPASKRLTERLAHQWAGILIKAAGWQCGQVAVHPVLQFMGQDAGTRAPDRALCLVGDPENIGLRIGGRELATKRCTADLRGHPAFEGCGQFGASKVPGSGLLSLADRRGRQHDDQRYASHWQSHPSAHLGA